MLRQGRVPRTSTRAGRHSSVACPLIGARLLASPARTYVESSLTSTSPATTSTAPALLPAYHGHPRPVLPPVRYSAQSFAMERVGVVERQASEELLLPLPVATESPVDDPSLENPLQRMERLSTGWFGVVMEYDGVVVETSDETHRQAWLQVADEFGYKRPLGQSLRRIKGVRDDVIVSRIFGWTHNPVIAQQVAQRKQELYDKLLGGRQPAAMLEARPFLDTLKRYAIPVALVSPQQKAKVHDGLQRHGLQSCFDATVAAEDCGSMEVEFYYASAARDIRRPPLRCVVVGESNTSVEAAHELGMKCVVVTGNAPVYDFTGADLVVRNLSQLSIMNLKRLFADENLVESRVGEEAQERGGVEEADVENDYFDDEDEDFKPFRGGAFGFGR